MNKKSTTRIIGKTELEKYIEKILNDSPKNLKISSESISKTVKKNYPEKKKSTYFSV